MPDKPNMPTDLLPSWRDTPTRAAIVDFVAAAQQLPPAERVAAFDNDGTLWTEMPLPVQADFLFRRLAEQAEADPSLVDRQPWKAVVEQDHAWLAGAITKHYQGDDTDLKVMSGGLLGAYEGATIEEFEAVAGDFLRQARHPTLDRPYVRIAFQPMVELLRYLEANGFTCYIVSGGGRDFVRAVSEEVYGIPPDRVIGSTVTLETGTGGSCTQPNSTSSTTGRRSRCGSGAASAAGRCWPAATPTATYRCSATRPVARPAWPCSSSTTTPSASSPTPPAPTPRLEQAAARGWTVVSVRDDWATVFAD